MPANLENSSGHKTGKGQFSFQSQRRAMPKNIQTTIQLYSFHMLASWFSKSFKLGFSSMWTENFQMYKLDLEKAEEPEIKLLTSIGSWKKKLKKKKEICFIDYTKAFDCVDHNKLRKILKGMGIPDHLTCLLRSLYAWQEETELELHVWIWGSLFMRAQWFPMPHGLYMLSLASVPFPFAYSPFLLIQGTAAVTAQWQKL